MPLNAEIIILPIRIIEFSGFSWHGFIFAGAATAALLMLTAAIFRYYIIKNHTEWGEMIITAVTAGGMIIVSIS